jgi:hypothetical protein
VKRTKLPKIVLGRSMRGSAPTENDSQVTFELESETGEMFEVSFSLRGILSTVVMANNWAPLKEALAELPPPTRRGDA